MALITSILTFFLLVRCSSRMLRCLCRMSIFNTLGTTLRVLTAIINFSSYFLTLEAPLLTQSLCLTGTTIFRLLTRTFSNSVYPMGCISSMLQVSMYTIWNSLKIAPTTQSSSTRTQFQRLYHPVGQILDLCRFLQQRIHHSLLLKQTALLT